MIRKVILFLAFIIICQNNSFSQANDVDANYHFEHDNYEVALKNYLRLYKTESENAFYNYRIGICYLNTNINKSESLDYLLFVANQEKLEKDIYYYLAQAFFYNFQFDSALHYYNLAKLEIGTKDEALLTQINKNINYTNNAIFYISQPLNVKFFNIGEQVNSKSAEYNPRIIDNYSTMLYNSNRKYLSDIQVYVNNLYVSNYENNLWKRGKSLGSKINSTEDDRLMGVSSNGDYLFIQRDDYTGFLDLYVSEKIKGRYREVVKLDKNINSKYHESGAYLSDDGQLLYFSSNRDGGYGGMDIYYSRKLPNGEWGEAQNLGSEINSEYDEDYPFFTDNENTLYFASNGKKSIGGYDLFVSYRKGFGEQWSEPLNLGYPVNSLYDNYFITLSENKRLAYVSDVREEGYGDYDIYKIVFDESEPDYQLFTGVISLNDTMLISNSEVEQELEINVYNAENYEVFGTYTYKKNNGKYIIALPPGKYILEIIGEYLIPYNKEIEITDDFAFQKEIQENIILKSK